MTMSPMLWGAGLACAMGGALAGTALGSTPILDRSTLERYYQSHGDTASRQAQAAPTPDHYPLVTRRGTVPVDQLSERGLFSQARYRSVALDAAYAPPAQGGGASYDPDVDGARFAQRNAALAAAEANAPDAMTPPQPATPLALADGPAAVAPQGDARIVNVSASLAMR